MKTCNFCGNSHSTEKEVSYIYSKAGQYFLVNHVPCEECDYCHEQYFKASVLKKIEAEFQNITSQKKRVAQTISMPVEEFHQF